MFYSVKSRKTEKKINASKIKLQTILNSQNLGTHALPELRKNP
jgi:hypothetical protein